MTTTSKSGLAVYKALTVITLTGFEGEPRYDGDPDPLGSANYFCEAYGMAPDGFADADEPGVLWTDYDTSCDAPCRFTVLVASDEVEAVKETGREAGYTIDDVTPITEPQNFGDGQGTVEILKHREGWVILG